MAKPGAEAAKQAEAPGWIDENIKPCMGGIVSFIALCRA
jgi:hypothetical protein